MPGKQLLTNLLRWRVVLPILAIVSAAYAAGLHPWLMNWGATPAEQRMSLPGDGLLPDPSHRFTRAISIDAPPAEVWPWLVQIGQDRGGFYSNTWLENLTGCDIHNAGRLHPEWQERALGEHVSLCRPDLLGGLNGRVAATAHTTIVLLQPDEAIADITGRFVLEPDGNHGTRLLLREPVPSAAVVRMLSAAVWDPAHFVMEQRVLRGIKERAEGRPLVPPVVLGAAHAGWWLAAIALLGLFLAQPRRRAWVLLPLLLQAPALISSGDWDAAIAGFLATGISLLGALVFGRRWWPAYLLIATAVALTLLLAPDAYAAFGLVFDALLLAGLAAGLRQLLARPHPRPAVLHLGGIS